MRSSALHPRSRLIRTSRILGVIGWLGIATETAVFQVIGATAGAGHFILFAITSVFFALQITRLVIAFITDPRRRLTPLLLLVAIVLWGIGSVVYTNSTYNNVSHFPAPGEIFALISYIAMAGYLVCDASRELRRSIDAWLHVLMILGGTACMAAILVLTPAAAVYRGDGVRLLTALLYPLIDLVLALLIIGQAVLHLREGRQQSALLLAGFLALAFADVQFVTVETSKTEQLSVVSIIAWAVGFALIVSSACQGPAKAARLLPRHEGPAQTLVAGAIAVAVLALGPEHGVGVYLTLPAVVTLIAAGGRLVLALRQATGAAEAVALSRTDDLTRLPNRRVMRAELDKALAGARPISLMVLDLDGFKDINDTLGHAAGDEVLKLMAHRIRDAMSPTAVVTRLGGDEFAIMTDDADSVSSTASAHALLAALRQPLRVEGVEIVPSASIGIANLSRGGLSAIEMLRRSDVAMYQAKKTRTGVSLYDADYDDFSRLKLTLAENLHTALRENQLELWYQPQISAATLQLCGLEALIRWRHPAQGVLAPAAFLPAARRCGLMPEVSAEVVRMAIAQVARWHAAGLPLRVALNCAPPELLSGTFLPLLYAAVADADLPPETLVVEVTEDCFITEPDRARRLLGEIRAHGMQVAIDDYGTGFSSLAYLRDLPIDELKIDQSFVASMQSDDRSRMIVASTLQMATALSMRTVAEGVEDPATAADLVSLGVDVLQGYLFARPMPAGEVAAWSEQRQLLALDSAALPLHQADDRWWRSSTPTRSSYVRGMQQPPRRPVLEG